MTKSSILRVSLYLTLLRAHSVHTALSPGHFSKTISGNCLISQLLEVATLVRADQKFLLLKFYLKGKVGNEISIRGFAEF